MLNSMEPRLRRSNVVLNSFSSCVSDATKEFSRTPEMSVSKMVSQPRMFLEKFKGTISLKQLKSFANTHCWRNLNKQVNVVNSDVKFVDFTSMFDCNLVDESFTINLKPIKLERIFGVFNFPDKMESILSKAMFETLQIHFLSPKSADKAHANFVLVQEPSISALHVNYSEELNIEDGDSSPNLKVWVSSPWM